MLTARAVMVFVTASPDSAADAVAAAAGADIDDSAKTYTHIEGLDSGSISSLIKITGI